MQANPYYQPNTRDVKPESSSKVTRFDLINKNYILPQGSNPVESSYTGDYKNNSNSRIRTERAAYPQNEVLPKGNFQGNSSYLQDYLRTPGVRGELMKREGELRVGGNKFEGNSLYTIDYPGIQGQRSEKVTFPLNKVMPEGKFQEGSTYSRNYLNNPLQHQDKIKPQGELKVGGNVFQGQSSYFANFQGRQNPSRSQKVVQLQNEMFPKGNFQGTSTYTGNYIQNPVQFNQNIRPQGELKVAGGHLEGYSNYTSDYMKKEGQKTERKPPIYNQVMPKGNFTGESSYSHSYIGTLGEKEKQFRPEGELKVGGKFQGNSSYVNDFESRGVTEKPEKIRYKDNEMFPKGQFEGRSTYENNHYEMQRQVNRQFKPQGELKVGGKFQGSSSYGHDYQSKGMGSRPERMKYKDNDVIPKGLFEGHSTYQNNHYEMERQVNRQFRPEGELKVGGKFEGNSNYAQNYQSRGLTSIPERMKYKDHDVIPKGLFEGHSTYQNNHYEMQRQINRQFRPEGELKVGGKFQGNSNYAQNYLETKAQRNPQIRPQGELNVGEGRFEGLSSYGAEYGKKEGFSRAEKAVPPQNDVMPRGQFEGSSTYEGAYLGGAGQKNPQIRPENNLSVGNTRFEGSSSYAVEYDPRTQGRRYLNRQSELQTRV